MGDYFSQNALLYISNLVLFWILQLMITFTYSEVFKLNMLKIKNPDDDVQWELPYVECFDVGFISKVHNDYLRPITRSPL